MGQREVLTVHTFFRPVMKLPLTELNDPLNPGGYSS